LSIDSPRVLIAGVSTRAVVESAVRAGFDVTSVDAYADIDQPAAARCLSLPRDFGRPWHAARAARATASERVDAVLYTSNIENHPRAVAALSNGRELWGNAPDTLRRARHPELVRDAFRAAGIPAPDAFVNAADERLRAVVRSGSAGGSWILKPVRSGGGQGVRTWRDGRVPRSHYVQAFVEGWPGSVVFVAARGRAAVLGVTRQIVGDPTFGAAGFRYCGSLLCAPGRDDAWWSRQATRLAGVAAKAFGLVGVGGVDFIAGRDVVHPIEVNPRWTASLELVERARGISVFGMHADACRHGVLPAVDASGSAGSRVYGKAIVFARHDATAGDTRPWLRDDSVRDVPPPGTRIAAGQPVCTVFAADADADACYAALVHRAQLVYGQLMKWNQEAA